MTHRKFHHKTHRRYQQIFAAAVLVSGPSLHAFAQTSSTWITDVGIAGGSWSNTANWFNGVVPDNGGTVTFNTLSSFTSAPINIVQDFPTVTVSGISFETQITYAIRPPTGGSNTLTLAGPATLDTPIANINTLATTFFGQQIQIPVAGSAGLTKRGPGTVTLYVANSYAGGTRVEGGVLGVRGGDAALGNAAGSVTLDGGTIRSTTGTWTSSRMFQIEAGGGTIEATTSGAATFNGAIGGPGSLNKTGSRGLFMTAAGNYTGATNLFAGSIGLAGNGAITGTSSITSRDSIVIDNTATNNTNRVNDAAALTLHGATIAFSGNASAASGEAFGATTFSRGTTTITVNLGAGQSATIALGAVRRNTGGAAFFRGASLGAAPGSNVANVSFAVAPTLVGGAGATGTSNISILPWAYGNTSGAAAAEAASNTFVTYGSNGVRPLDAATEHSTTIPGGAITAGNVRITSAQALTAATTINSLTIAGAGGVNGGGTLTIASGALLNLQNGVTITAPLHGGAAELILHAPASINFAGVISGTGGLTKQGAGVATFANAANTYTGTTTIGAGTAVFLSSVPSAVAGPFGGDPSPIAIAPAGTGIGGTTARLVYGGASPATFDRDLNVSARIAFNNAATLPGFGLSTAQTLTMNGEIRLDDSPLTLVGTTGSTLLLNGRITGAGGPVTDRSTGAGTIRVNGNNNFTGDVELSGATWQIGSDTAFGDGGLLKMVQLSGQPTIMAVGGARMIANPTVSFSFSANYWQIAGADDLTFTGSINLSGSYTHNINNTALTNYAGVLHTGGFTKAGNGTLVLSAANIYTGSTTISSGVLRVTNSSALGSTAAPTIVNSGAMLELRSGALTSEPVTINGTGVVFLGASLGALFSSSGDNSVGDVIATTPAFVGVEGGSSLAAGNLTIAAGQSVSKEGLGVLTINRVRGAGLAINAGVARVAAGRSADKTSIVTSLTISTGATLDLGDNDFIIDYTTASPLAGVISGIATGSAGGLWNGLGINSSAAAANSSTALGVAEAGDLLSEFPAIFSGQTVDATSVLIRYTLRGDADLNGQVNLDDFTRLAAGFGSSSSWSSGDSNYDGATNLDDFTALAANFGSSLPADSPRAAIPEPVAGAVLGSIGFACLALRRRRSLIGRR